MHHAYTKQGTYFQFPLCALAYGATVKDRLNTIMEFSCRLTGLAEWNRMNATARHQWVERMRASPKRPTYLDFEHLGDIAFVLGAQVIRVDVHGSNSSREHLHRFDEFRTGFEQLHGRDASVRIKTAYVLEARDGGGITYRELSVLAAIHSILGRSRVPVQISQAAIRCRALGYRSAAVRAKAQADRTDDAEPLTDWQLRSTLESLHRRKFFHRLTFGRRRTFYGVGQTEKEFQKAVRDRLVRKESSYFVRRSETQSFDDDVRNLRAALRGEAPPAPHAGRSDAPPWEDTARAEAPFIGEPRFN